MKQSFLLLLLVFSACAEIPTEQQVASADYGPPPTVDYRKAIRDKMELVLVDPRSAEYKFTVPYKGYIIEPFVGTHYGWKVDALINSKNMMGGYTGFSQFSFIFFSNSIIGWETDRELVKLAPSKYPYNQ